MHYLYGLRKELEMLEDALDAADIAWWVMELPSGVVFFSPKKVEMLGYDRDEASEFVHYSNFTDLLHPDDHDACMQAMRNHLDGKTSKYEITYRIKIKKGDYVKLLDRGRIVLEHKNEITIAGAVIKLTE